jgi:hypothetical protein
MIELISLILILLFFNQEVFKKTSNKCIKKQEGYNQGYINPYHTEEYNTAGPNNEYYYDLTGRKGTMFRILPPINNPESVLKPPEKKEDHFNCVVNKLGIYNEDIYNTCNQL